MGAVSVLVAVFRLMLGNLRSLAILGLWGAVPLALAAYLLLPVASRGVLFSGPAIAAFLGFWGIYAVVAVWFAVHWHRALLTDRRLNPIRPGIPIGGMLAYVMWSLLVWILLLIVLLGPTFLLANVATLFLSDDISFPPSFMDLLPLHIASAISGLIFFYVTIRIAPVLPAAALDRQISSSDAALATAGRGAFPLALLVLVLSLAGEGLVAAITPHLSPWLQVGLSGIWQAISALFLLTLLTAIYQCWMPEEQIEDDGPDKGPGEGSTRSGVY